MTGKAWVIIVIEILAILVPEILYFLVPEILNFLVPEISNIMIPEIISILVPEILNILVPEILNIFRHHFRFQIKIFGFKVSNIFSEILFEWFLLKVIFRWLFGRSGIFPVFVAPASKSETVFRTILNQTFGVVSSLRKSNLI